MRAEIIKAAATGVALAVMTFFGPAPARAQTESGVTFTQAPQVDGRRLTFAVSAPTDVEVSVLNAEGKIVNHWAAGVLGGDYPPPPPLQPGLSQTLEWDGKDNKGNTAEGGPFSFRVRAGIQPKFDRMLLHNPHASGQVLAIGAGPGGQLYVFHKHNTANGNMGTHDIKIYDPDGRYLRALKPFAADIPAERVAATGAFEDEEGRLVPRIYNWQHLSFYPDPHNARMTSLPPRSVPAVDSRGTVYWVAARGRARTPLLLAIEADGGVSRKEFKGPRILPEIKNLGLSLNYPQGTAYLAMSSDDQHLYVSGLSLRGKGAGLLPCVARVDAATLGPGEIFIGNPDQRGTEKALLTSPRGVAAAGGKLYVADMDANRVAVFSEKDGSFVGEVSVPNPDTIGVDPETGALYVCSVEKRLATLIKFDGYQNGQELYRTALPKARGHHRIVVNAGTRPVRIWVPALHYGAGFTCIEDTGTGFETLGDPRPEGVSAAGPRDLTFDRIRGELYVKVSGERWYRISEKTGEIVDEIFFGASHRMGDKGTQLVVHEDGSLISLSYMLGLWRWTRDAKPLPWEGREDNRGTWGGIMMFMQNYLAVHGDEIFAIPPTHYRDKTKRGRFNTLNVFGMDQQEKRTAIWQVTQGTIPRVDRHGNIYLASMLRPPGRVWPEFFDDKLPQPDERMRYSPEYWYSYMYGGIAKFPPSGGAIWFVDGEIPGSAVGQPPAELASKPKIEFSYHYQFSSQLTGHLQGAEWLHFGFSPYSETYPAGTPTCMCEGAGFDVDDWGRIFYPNLGKFRIEMIDNNRNFIGTFGHYGNEDSLGNGQAAETAWQHEGTSRSHPDIPLAWPTYVAVSDTHAYVNDTLGRRVVSVRLNAALSETVAVP